MRTFTMLLLIALAACAAQADLLTDTQMYCDPASIAYDAYAQITLSAGGSCFWPTGQVTDVDVLPPLKAGDYGAGYAYSQADYLREPTVDYTADLTAGILTLTFDASGLYHVRVAEDDASTTYALFVGIDAIGKGDKPTDTGPNQQVPVPAGDLFLVDDTDATVENNMAAVLAAGGRTVQRIGSRQAAIEAIEAASKAAGRKLHVEICGHGCPGAISTGASQADIPDEQIDGDSVAAFQEAVDPYVNHITFQGCAVGQGEAGRNFLQILADSIGRAGAWDNTLYVSSDGFYVETGTSFITVPEPAIASLLAAGVLVLLGRRRRRRQ